MAAHFHRAEHHHSPIIVFFQWLIAILGFLWGTQARAEVPIWQPAWFADLASEANRSPSSLNRTPLQLTTPSSMSISADTDQSSERPTAFTAWISTSSPPDGLDPAQFTSYETMPLHLTPTVTLFRIPE